VGSSRRGWGRSSPGTGLPNGKAGQDDAGSSLKDAFTRSDGRKRLPGSHQQRQDRGQHVGDMMRGPGCQRTVDALHP
jgi:hypothetical protein